MLKALSLLTLLIVGFFVLRDPTLYVDERVHYPVTVSFCQLNPTIHPNLTNIPAYHALVGLSCYLGSFLSPLDSLAGIRLLSLALALPTLLFTYLIAKHLKFKNPQWLTLLALFLPIAFPFYFLIYTDMLALASVLAAYYLYLTGRFSASGAVATLSVAIRQNNIIWLGWIALLIFLDEFQSGWQPNFRAILTLISKYLQKAWTFILGTLAFGGFIYLNGGISLAKAEEWAHPSFSLKLGNLYLFLLLFAFLYWPLFLDSLFALKRLVRNKVWLISFLALAVTLSLTFLFTFQNNHPYNQHTFALHNWLLVLTTSSLFTRLVTLVPLLSGLLLLFLSPLRSFQSYSLYLFSLLFILPSWLIEPRYYIVPYLFFLLLKKPTSATTTKILLSWQFVLSLIVIIGILTHSFFT